MKLNLIKVHFWIGSKIIIILVGGKKGSQKHGIEKAARYLAGYRGENQ